MRYVVHLFVILIVGTLVSPMTLAATVEQDVGNRYQLGIGDVIRINVFKIPDMTLDARINESGSITYPLIGSVPLAGMSVAEAELEITNRLKFGNYVKNPQVTITLMQVRGNQVSVLGHVNRPGRFPLETTKTYLSDVLAMAGGASPTGSDLVVIVGERKDKRFRQEVDFPAIFSGEDQSSDIRVRGGDVIYVKQASMFYIYGQVQRPGAYRLERNMTVQQALALGGGINVRGTENGIRLHRKQADGSVEELTPKDYDQVEPDDVIYIRESIF